MAKGSIVTNEQLENEKEGKLLFSYAVPSIISMTITSIYNIVDQIFIGRGVGYLANAATNVVFPLVTFTMGLTLMIAHGTSTYVNLKLGEGKREEAGAAASSSLLVAVVSLGVISILCMIFLKPLLYLFGATELSYPYAWSYAFIILCGVPVHAVSSVLNNCIRADGNPRFSMISLSSGAVLNCILDPIFIFAFKWGVAGGALATVIGQCLSCFLGVLYIKRFRNFTIKRQYMSFKAKCLPKIISLGTSTFAMRMCMVVMQVVLNNELRTYGALSIYGADIALAATGITQKINTLMQSCVQGIATGQQPIIGYNYGAKKYERVKRTYMIAMVSSVALSSFFFILVMLIPRQIITLFGSDSELYIEFGVMCLKYKFCLVFTMGITFVTAYFFQAIGRPAQSVTLTVLRQLGLMVPLLIILPKFFGVMGTVYAFPVRDFLSTILTLIFAKGALNLLLDKQRQRDALDLLPQDNPPA